MPCALKSHAFNTSSPWPVDSALLSITFTLPLNCFAAMLAAECVLEALDEMLKCMSSSHEASCSLKNCVYSSVEPAEVLGSMPVEAT